ncbi:AraC family transcriptional regulator [Chromobacterium phragmitis]|uniref:AraC family transcriptional regulator n=1 Tax=Chromobacterium phragmitis TaxID=2202141 RepID=A0A344UKZ1_9NEIS|nr:helix-turn-helix transcriptional regulator [Chromobacterium phragmitis]AXE30567.1 AraC family transcriptional regulator [Chromobacterium phragmitis]AXE35939.1 AraC family transcriptional regulator [Chromobacterium phragmitis]
MSRLHIILNRQAGLLRIDGQAWLQEASSLTLYAGSSALDVPSYACGPSELQPICRDLEHLMSGDAPAAARKPEPRMVSAGPELLLAVSQLAQADLGAMLRFALAYCLTVDKAQCSALLRHLLRPDQDLFDFIHRHRLRAWPVECYADALGLPPRKFNQLFKEKFGVPAKHWLLTQRLEHARRLLETTSKKVIDVAMESGFGNAAHFSDSFRRHFQMTPSDARRGALCARRQPAPMF